MLAAAPLLLTLLAMSTPPTAAGLKPRLELAALPGVEFVRAPPPVAAEPTPLRDGVTAPSCPRRAAGLCDIVWTTTPQAFVALPLPADWQRRLATGEAEVALRSSHGQPLLVVAAARHQVLLAFELDDSEPTQPGATLGRWPYLNYLLHVAACQAAAQPPPRFAHWEHSPLPGPRSRLLLVGYLALFWLLAVGLYRLARRAGAKHPEAARRFLTAVAAARQGSPTDADAAPLPVEAFARPLSGLLTILAAMVVLIGPYFAIQSLLAQRVQPFPEADGLWGITGEVLYILWLTFDLGTQTAFVKYFAEHRVNKPEAALRDIQFYIWFQVFSRLVEMSLLLLFALGYLGGTLYARYVPLVLLYTVIGQPAFTAIGKFLCQAMQRFDYYNLLDFLEQRLLCFLVPVPLVLLGRAWGRSHPEFGEAYGAALGMGLGAFTTGLVMLGLGLFALRRLGLPLLPLFLAQFERDTARRQLWFGFKLTLGQEPFRLTSSLQNLILDRWLRDSATWIGIYYMLHNRLTFLAFFAWGYYQSAVPAVSEALGAGKRRLVQYYVLRYLQFGFLFSSTICSLLLAIGPLYIRVGLGGQWARAADYLVLAALSGLFLPFVWLTDSLQQGAGRPGTTTVVMLLEQGTRLLLLWLLVPRFQFLGIYLATISTLLLKVLVSWTINHRTIVRLALPLWPVLVAPGLGGLCNYGLWHSVARLLAPQRTATVLLLFFVAGAGSIGLNFFLCGLLGGFDRAARRELAQAGRLSALLGPLGRGLARLAETGARLSPYQPALPTLCAAAQQEAAELEGQREPPPATK